MSDQLERANETADVANIRSAYATAMAEAALGNTSPSSGVTYTSGSDPTWAVTVDKMKSTGNIDKIGDLPTYIGGLDSLSVTTGGSVTVTVHGDGTAEVAAA